MAKKSKKYYFIHKENLKIRAKTLMPLVDKVYENFYSFIDMAEGLKKDEFIVFSNIFGKAGLTDKLLKKMEIGIENMRKIYMDLTMDIFQTRIEDFNKEPEKED